MMKMRPGEFVEEVATPGKALPINRPPGSVVGIVSFSNLPKILKLGLKTWSILTISWWKLKMFRPMEVRVHPPVQFGLSGCGSLLKMSLIYACAAGEMLVT